MDYLQFQYFYNLIAYFAFRNFGLAFFINSEVGFIKGSGKLCNLVVVVGREE